MTGTHFKKARFQNFKISPRQVGLTKWAINSHRESHICPLGTHKISAHLSKNIIFEFFKKWLFSVINQVRTKLVKMIKLVKSLPKIIRIKRFLGDTLMTSKESPVMNFSQFGQPLPSGWGGYSSSLWRRVSPKQIELQSSNLHF